MNTRRNRSMDRLVKERSGHTAVVVGRLLFMWGGYLSIDDEELFLSNEEIWQYDLDTGMWKLFHTTGEVPPPMSGTCSSSLNGHMYIFGGCDANGPTNQMYCVDLTAKKLEWRKVVPQFGTPPSPRDKLCCWVYKGRLIYFGGYGHKTSQDVRNRSQNFIVDEASQIDNKIWGWNNEVHEFDVSTATWREPQNHGRPPAPRAAHAGVILGSKAYVYGGRVMQTRTSEMYVLDLETWTWSEIFPKAEIPVGRSWHTLTALSDTTMFLFGGLSADAQPMSDGWLFDVETNKWTQIAHPHGKKPRLWHTATASKDSDVVVFGGSSDNCLLVDSGHCNEALVFQTQPHSLSRICEDYIAKIARESKTFREHLSILPTTVCKSLHLKIYFHKQ